MASTEPPFAARRSRLGIARASLAARRSRLVVRGSSCVGAPAESVPTRRRGASATSHNPRRASSIPHTTGCHARGVDRPRATPRQPRSYLEFACRRPCVLPDRQAQCRSPRRGMSRGPTARQPAGCLRSTGECSAGDGTGPVRLRKPLRSSARQFLQPTCGVPTPRCSATRAGHDARRSAVSWSSSWRGVWVGRSAPERVGCAPLSDR